MDESEDDFSRRFQELRPTLVSGAGVRYLDFIKTLKPDYARLYKDIAIGYAALIGTVALIAMIPLTDTPLAFFGAMVGAVSIGFWVAYLQLFIHEGAHFNFAEDHAKSDYLCNLLIAWMIGTSVQQYRVVHFQHHRALGRTDDSESTYFSPLNPLFFFKTLFGIRVLEVLGSRSKVAPKAKTASGHLWVGRIGICLHVAIVLSAWMSRELWVCVTWIIGMTVAFPFFGAIRQLLEHRDPRAKSDTDYSTIDHGAYTRVFGSGIFASVFGGAGFNRHLLHHWEPQISYTNLPEMEAYLLDTQVAPIIEMRRSTYGNAFRSLFRFS